MSHEKQIESICQEVFGKQPVKIKKFDSLSNFVYYIEFDDQKRYVLKIWNKDADNVFLFDEKNNQQYLKKSPVFQGLIFKEHPDWNIENYINGDNVPVEWHRDQEKRLLYMKRVSELNKLASKDNMEEHLVYKFFVTIRDKVYTKIRKNFEGHERLADVNKVLDHFDWYFENVIKKHNLNEKLIFQHNDLLNGNIVYDKTTEKLNLIDFEYNGFGFFCTEIYNILLESTYDYNDDHKGGFIQSLDVLPSADKIKQLIKYHLFFTRYGEKYMTQEDTEANLAEVEKDENMQKINDDEVEGYYKNFGFYSSFCDLYWTIWAFYMFFKPDCELDYIEYGFSRYNDFLRDIEGMNLNYKA